MLKIYNYMDHGGNAVYGTIANGLLDYIPGDRFREVFDIQEADILLMRGVVDAQGVFRVDLSGSQLSDAILNHIELDIKTRNALLAEQQLINDTILEKRRIIWIDALGPGIHRDSDSLSQEKTGLRDDDIIISPVSLGNRPNTLTGIWHIEKSVFRPRGRFEREKGSVTICNDNIEPGFFVNHAIDILEMVQAIMPVVSNLYITGAVQMSDELESGLGEASSKVTCLNLNYPRGVAYRLAKSEFVLTTRESLGIETMGIEGGLAGCQPVYPGTPFFRDAFDGTGVVFYDTENRASSLRSIIEAGSQWDAETLQAFQGKFSAEDTLPDFWDSVYELYSE